MVMDSADSVVLKHMVVVKHRTTLGTCDALLLNTNVTLYRMGAVGPHHFFVVLPRMGTCASTRGCGTPTNWRGTVLLGVFVTREHVRHNKSGITHRGKTRISH
jgi:hypothetical protein